jgi:hypothetical protein
MCLTSTNIHRLLEVRIPSGGPKVTFAKLVETFFEVSIGSAPSLSQRCQHDHIQPQS